MGTLVEKSWNVTPPPSPVYPTWMVSPINTTERLLLGIDREERGERVDRDS